MSDFMKTFVALMGFKTLVWQRCLNCSTGRVVNRLIRATGPFLLVSWDISIHQVCLSGRDPNVNQTSQPSSS